MTVSASFEATDGGLVLANAILLYRSEAPLSYAAKKSGGPTFASMHVVDHSDGQPMIAAGVPLSRAHIRQWTAALGQTVLPEILPANVLVSHPDILVWWVPAAVRTSYFALTSPPKGLAALAARTVMPLPYPAHVFIATRGRLWVYALPTSERPAADTVLLHSPVLNVYTDGSLCWGNIAFPKTITVAAIPEFERAVFDSWSTHPNPGQEATVSGKGGLVRLWDRLATRKAVRFPTHRLKPFRPRSGGNAAPPMTLGEVIKRSARS
ncbi:PRTRC system protein B [Sphingomonas sp. GM_Shp_1]|uniref:PRTRC system protein B n=1 Tax=Sphingomonas sp. GM_Shp_1 TaxID=2937381 RepID=UPI00226B3812|nr:PRTRC system protein B [Sphingomonas sp. GM_Shp_1]